MAQWPSYSGGLGLATEARGGGREEGGAGWWKGEGRRPSITGRACLAKSEELRREREKRGPDGGGGVGDRT